MDFDFTDDIMVARTANSDVFVWPSEEWSLLYCHEELSEWGRVIQKQNAPDHARNSSDVNLSLDEREHLEAGQALMMLGTLMLQRHIDPRRALRLALEKVYATSEKKRAEAQDA